MRQGSLWAVLWCFCAVAGAADEEKKSNFGWYLLGTEAVILAGSRVMSGNPEGYGRALIVMSPLLAGATLSETSGEVWPRFVMTTALVAAYGVWNTSMKNDERDKVFRNNVIFYNALFIPLGAMKWWERTHDNSPTLSFGYTFEPKGAAMIAAKYRF